MTGLRADHPSSALASEPGWLRARHGSAKTDRPAEHPRPPGVSDQTIAALGKLSEALEAVEHARGLLYGFHRLSGTADLTLQEAVKLMREAGHDAVADEVDEVLVGRDGVRGLWTFQVVESYDANYWTVFRDVERHVRERLGGAQPHILEGEMKAREQRS